MSRASRPPPKPSKADLAAAVHKTVPDVIAPNLRVLFCGINPGLYTAAIGHHFGRPGNRFWPALHQGGFTDRQLKPWDEQELLSLGCGITNVVMRTTATAAELSTEELLAGGRALASKLKRYRPAYLAVLGVGAYRTAFLKPRAELGLQPEAIADSRIWVLPNPSGLNAHYRQSDLSALFSELRAAAQLQQEPGR